MKKFINIIEKASRIRNRFRTIIRGDKYEKKNDDENHGNHNHNHHNNGHQHVELDDHNDSSNWTYN